LGERIVTAASKSDAGWSWGDDSTGFQSKRPLTGLGHGAAGFGWALLELFQVSGERRYLEGGEQAFRYEQSWFRDPPGNWPDFRFFDGEAEPPPYGLAWCQGATGIGLTRLRALKICPSEQYRNDVAAALRAVEVSLAEGPPPGERDFSLCHGVAGMGDFLLEASRVLSDPGAEAKVKQLAMAAAARHRTKPDGWPSGVQAGSNPSLMLGVAGVGYFLLRLTGPRLQSILL
jgi:lantibiotic modifying enzyme